MIEKLLAAVAVLTLLGVLFDILWRPVIQDWAPGPPSHLVNKVKPSLACLRWMRKKVPNMSSREMGIAEAAWGAAVDYVSISREEDYAFSDWVLQCCDLLGEPDEHSRRMTPNVDGFWYSSFLEGDTPEEAVRGYLVKISID